VPPDGFFGIHILQDSISGRYSLPIFHPIDALGVDARCLRHRETDTGGAPLSPISGSTPGVVYPVRRALSLSRTLVVDVCRREGEVVALLLRRLACRRHLRPAARQCLHDGHSGPTSSSAAWSRRSTVDVEASSSTSRASDDDTRRGCQLRRQRSSAVRVAGAVPASG